MVLRYQGRCVASTDHPAAAKTEMTGLPIENRNGKHTESPADIHLNRQQTRNQAKGDQCAEQLLRADRERAAGRGH